MTERMTGQRFGQKSSSAKAAAAHGPVAVLDLLAQPAGDPRTVFVPPRSTDLARPATFD